MEPKLKAEIRGLLKDALFSKFTLVGSKRVDKINFG
jgi:hypothetical protein